MKNTLIVAARGSRLALVQVDEALEALNGTFPSGTSFEKLVLDTPGDRDLQTSLSDTSVPDDFFTRDIDDALRTRKADLAIHSAKDLPQELPDGIAVAAYLPAKDIRDALVVRSDIQDAPSIIGTSSPRREDVIAELYPDAVTKPIRGDIGQRMEKLDAGDYDAIIVAACALDRLGFSDRISSYLPCDPAPQQGRLAITVRANDTELLEILKAVDVRRTAGLVAIIGCSADASLISHRAEMYLEQADVIFHDRLIPDEILLRYHDKAVPVGKVAGEKSIPESEIHRMVLQEAERGKLVVRLHGGDPGIYGHLGEELEFFTGWDIRLDIVPSLTAAQVAATHSHTALTNRYDNRNITFISGHSAPGKERPPLPGPEAGSLAIYMAASAIKDMQGELIANGRLPDAAVVIGERLGYKDERVLHSTLQYVADGDYESPTVFLVGNRSYPPTGTTLFVGTNPEHFLNHGPLVHFPLIKLVARPLKERVTSVQDHLDDVDGIIFPSRYAIECFTEALLEVGDVRALSGKKILAVGPTTGDALKQVGLHADIAEQSLKGIRALAEHLTEDFKGRYLYPTSDVTPVDERVELMKQHGIDLVPTIFYSNRITDFKELPRTPFSRVLFTSGSTVKAYFERYPEELEADRTWIAVGPSTLRAIEERGLRGELL